MLFINDNRKEFTPQIGKIVLYAASILLLQELLVLLLEKCQDKTALIVRLMLLAAFTVVQWNVFIKINIVIYLILEDLILISI